MIQENSQVRRNQPGDYTHGRTGTVVELDEAKGRARVYWTHNPSGTAMSDAKRTWVKLARLEELPEGWEPDPGPIHYADYDGTSMSRPICGATGRTSTSFESVTCHACTEKLLPPILEPDPVPAPPFRSTPFTHSTCQRCQRSRPFAELVIAFSFSKASYFQSEIVTDEREINRLLSAREQYLHAYCPEHQPKGRA